MKEMSRLSKQEKEEMLAMLNNGDECNFNMSREMFNKYVSIYPKELKFIKKGNKIIKERKHSFHWSNMSQDMAYETVESL